MSIEALDQTVWDTVITGTGLRESLLAAALARAGKKVLHLDRNPFYGDEYAALSLDELEAWAQDAKIRPSHIESVQYRTHPVPENLGLKKSRSYTLSLSPGILYAASPILSLLVKGNLHESLEFLKVGGWFVYDAVTVSSDPLKRVPNSREDIFNDKTLDPRTKRVVVRALKSMVGLEGGGSETGSTLDNVSLQQYLERPPFRLPSSIIAAFTSLTLSHNRPNEIPFDEAERKIKRHFDSLGRFGAGFSAVIGRYGSGSELVQVLCRAAAVTGNAVYVLANGIVEIQEADPASGSTLTTPTQPTEQAIRLCLNSGDLIQTRHIVGTSSNLPTEASSIQSSSGNTGVWMSIYVVSSSLKQTLRTDDPPTAAGAIIYIPAESIQIDNCSNINPIYVAVHGSDTGECPEGQSVLYVSMKDTGSNEVELLDAAVKSLLQNLSPEEDITNSTPGHILLSVSFRTLVDLAPSTPKFRDNVHVLPRHAPMIETPDFLVEQTMEIYEKIVGSRVGFLEKASSQEPETPEEMSG
ncbi:Rab proteins geranylgeranyltransferase component A [Arthrobotrys musiformis]|uniref:Rab proteins geranylgeranyltransferase component A n=1 Tax=Arthrobotrys musiformis TaxID=47236 RepID=A0AAV9WNX2_9PEZI